MQYIKSLHKQVIDSTIIVDDVLFVEEKAKPQACGSGRKGPAPQNQFFEGCWKCNDLRIY
jgi:hypothetical protein